MNNEFKGQIISGFAESKSKMYSLIAGNGGKVKRAKGVNKNVAKNMGHKEFVDALINKIVMRHNMKRIQSKLHRIRTYDVCKI